MTLAQHREIQTEQPEIRQVTPGVGAEVRGVDLGADLAEATIARLRAALIEHGVLFFRDQPITPDRQVAFARRFGHVPKVPDSMFLVHEANPFVSVLANDADRPPTVNNWHSDYSFAAEPDFASVLRSVVVPDCGGDTVWAGMFAAWEGLPDRMQHYLDGLTATHDFMKLYERPVKKRLWEGERGQLMEAARRQFPPVSHPVVRAHPESGRKALFVNESFTRHIDGMSESESRHLLACLFEHCKAPEFQVRFRWSPDCVAMWDNRSTIHYAVADFHPARRLMHRVTVLERPRAGDQD
ncbi:TauD/TfdA dioxygenase family protein [Minwuia thermotolerans]|uniref:Taurine dioxygenase n=1 Tax=Minwuia thermotolerans TaxID=2056226 RepID=A0A2M9FYY8_9PROT|nr:TauD/TfdA family dioxygenase [Minwuia thermotolerans]PJK28678.1 taurine dioxygenase [Minwuia thermotolerans]